MTNILSRRDFLKLGGATVGALAIGEFIPPLVDNCGPGRNEFRVPERACRRSNVATAGWPFQALVSASQGTTGALL